jgi:multiple sugar transport system substrate-binding protein
MFAGARIMKTLRLAFIVCLIALISATLYPTAPTHAAGDQFPALVKWPAKIAGGNPVTISVTNKPPASDAIGLKEWQDEVDRFTKLYPNVTIQGNEYTYTPDSFAALVAGKQVPTIFQVYLTDPQKYINLGVAADITKIINDNKLADVFNPALINLGKKDGKIYGLPYLGYATGIGYNIKMLKDAGIDKAPATWAELEADAKKLTNRDNGVSGFSFINDGSAATGWHFTMFSYTYGATPGSLIVDKDGKYTAGFGKGPALDALKFIQTLRWTDDVLPRETLDWAGNGTALATGKAAIVMMAGDQYGWIKRTYKDVDMTNIGFAPMPAGPGGSVSLIGGNMYMVSSAASADEQEAAVYFELYRLFDPANDQANLEAAKTDNNPTIGGPDLPLFTGSYEAARKAFEKTYYTLPYENYSAFLDAIASGKAKLQVEPSPAGQEYYGAVGTVVTSVLSDQSVDPAKALDTAATAFQSTALDRLNGVATPAATSSK